MHCRQQAVFNLAVILVLTSRWFHVMMSNVPQFDVMCDVRQYLPSTQHPTIFSYSASRKILLFQIQ